MNNLRCFQRSYRQRRVLTTGFAAAKRGVSTTATVPLIINGKDVVTDETCDVISPITGKHVWSFSSATESHVDEAIENAQKAFPSWSQTKVAHRRDLLLTAADILHRRQPELGEYAHHEIGADKGFQDFIIGLSIDALRDTAGRISGAMQGSLPESNLPGMKAMVLKKPYGVNVGIAPWNAPFNLGLRSVLFALATGNTAILKGSEYTPRCYWAIADVFREAGLPDGCLNLILHSPAVGGKITKRLVEHPHTKKINFTGSTRVGSIIAEMAGKHLKPVLMELGGKASAVVLKDADLELAAQHCAHGAFLNAGQICMSTERILVDQSIASEFEGILTRTIREIFGSPESTPMLVTAASAKRNRGLIANAVENGAKEIKIFNDGYEPTVETHMRPVVLKGIESNMDLYANESFGPSVSFFTFKSEEEAIKLANDTEYGLSASVFTEDLKAGFRVAEQLESGAVHINSMTVHDESPLPHGGVKKSGFGRFNGYQGLDEFLYYKTVTWME
ncbi:hypothetical protein S40288_03556 [Stachybotrys chartarum IBT 40288]|nr:hypothetical protein S40288_03556 [Stachybotrys chartarum IBT 40288]